MDVDFTIVLSTGTTVKVNDPICLIDLTPEEYEELMALVKNKEAA